jgi:LysM repeat protein
VRPPTSTPVPAVVITATATPPEATFTPGPKEPVTYRVQPGDTLITIAAQFDVTVDDIIAANDLADPNRIQVGQELVIPVGGLPEPTLTATPLPRPSDTPGPTATPQPPMPTPTGTPTLLPVTPPATEPAVAIREILGAGVLADEAVLIFNGGRAVRMEGWTLSDAQDNVYTFPNLFLGTGGSVRVHTVSGSNSATDLYWGLDAPVWGEPGDVATLKDESNLMIDTFELP